MALWHGIAPGFFLCFIGEFVIIVMEQQVREMKNFKPIRKSHFVPSTLKLLSGVMISLHRGVQVENVPLSNSVLQNYMKFSLFLVIRH